MIGSLIEKAKTAKKIASIKVDVHKPEILFGAGLACIFIGVVEACRSTLDAEDVIEPAIEDIEDIREDVETEIITKKEGDRELVSVYLHTGRDLALIYAKSAFFLTAGVVCLTKSHNTLKKRYFGAVAAYKLLEEDISNYRKNVVAELGEEADIRFRNGLRKEKKAIETNVTDSDGNVKKEKVKDALIPEYGHSPYSRFFDETSDAWSPSPEYNKTYISAQMATANDKLRSRGWITLAEVYELLGFDATEASLAVGWVLGNGDDEVKFNMYDVQNEATRRFVNGYEPSVLLDFNVDGVILDKLRTIGLRQI